MAAVRPFFKQHPALSYFVLTFVLSWGCILLVVGPGGILGSPAQVEILFPFVFLAMLVGPFVSGLLLTGLVHGKQGYRDLLARLIRVRVNVGWYGAALLIAPVMVVATLLLLLLASPMYLPGIFTAENKGSLIVFGFSIAFGAGIFEEIGWTGFVIPVLRQRYSVLKTGLIVGFLWGLWHVLVSFWGSGKVSGGLDLSLFIPPLFFYAGVLPVYRVLMVWVYDRSQSLLLAILMHACLTASVPMILAPPELIGTPLVIWYLVLTATLWLFVAVIAWFNGGRLTRPVVEV